MLPHPGPQHERQPADPGHRIHVGDRQATDEPYDHDVVPGARESSQQSRQERLTEKGDTS